MKSKTLVAMAIASTFGWSATSIAGNGHEVVTPFSPNESGEVTFVHTEGFGSKKSSMSSFDTASSHAGGSVAGSTFDVGPVDQSTASSDWSMSDTDEALALGDAGIYTQYSLVSFAPIEADSWGDYVIDTGSDELALMEPVYFLTPTYDVVLIDDMSADFASDLGE